MNSHSSGARPVNQPRKAPKTSNPVHLSLSGTKPRNIKALRRPLKALEFSVSSPFKPNEMLARPSKRLSTRPMFESRTEPYDNLAASMVFRSNIVTQVQSNARGCPESPPPEDQVGHDAIAFSATTQNVVNQPSPSLNDRLDLSDLWRAALEVENEDKGLIQVAPSPKDQFDHAISNRNSPINHFERDRYANGSAAINDSYNHCYTDCEYQDDDDDSNDSDATIDDPNWPQPNSNTALNQNQSYPFSDSATASTSNRSESWSYSTMTPDKKKAKIQPIYNGPPAYLLDKNRQDPYAHGLNPLLNETIRIRRKRKRSITPDDQVDSPVRLIDDMSIPTERNPWVGKISGNPTNQSQGDFLRERQERQKRQEYQEMMTEKKKKWDEEMFIGLANFDGSQRGWNGEHESDRQRSLQRQAEEENQEETVRMEKMRAASTTTGKSKEGIISTRSSRQNSSSSKGKGKYGTAKDIEDAYTTYQAKAIQSHANLQEHCDREYAKALVVADEREWDPDKIKKHIIAEAAEKKRIEDRKAARRAAGRAVVKPQPENSPSSSKKRRKTSPEERLGGNLGRHWDPVVGKRESKKP